MSDSRFSFIKFLPVSSTYLYKGFFCIFTGGIPIWNMTVFSRKILLLTLEKDEKFEWIGTYG